MMICPNSLFLGTKNSQRSIDVEFFSIYTAVYREGNALPEALTGYTGGLTNLVKFLANEKPFLLSLQKP